MSAKENPCRKFQANIFNKSKCQNCFKPRESHLLNDEDLNQAKPIYGGWLLLAPEGTDFDNPVHRSRKWQRRFFILYEHGLLRYALDEMPTTLPQGTINMNQCTDVVDGEGRTGQKFSLCILTPEKEHFIRAENKEIISGWLEMLIVYPRTNKQNQKKKRKVEPPTPQEPGPAKMAVTSSNIPSAEKIPTTKSTLWQEEIRAKDQPDGNTLSPVPSSGSSQVLPASPLKEPGLENKEEESTMNGDRVDCGRKARVESGYFSLEKTKQDLKAEEQQLPPPPSPPSPSIPNNRRSQVIEKFEALDIEKAEHMETNLSAGPVLSSDTRQGRSEKRVFPRKRDCTTEAMASAAGSIPDVSASPLSPHRRAKSLDRRSTESSMTPDLLNFKKGWLTKQYEDGQWKKHWFVLADQSLRYYRDSVAEEAADLDGEIDLSTCCNVTEYPVQRNYGFQIHTKEGEFTLSAMTSGIRRNWIQTIMKHVHPTTAPDVTRKNVYLSLSVLKPRLENCVLSCFNILCSLPEEKNKTSPSFETCSKPSEKQDVDQAELDPEQKRSRARERRREGRSKTFDWAEFRPIQQALAQERANATDSSKTREPGSSEMDLTELEKERARRREERRKRFEMIDSVDGPSADDTILRMEVDRSPVLPVATELKPQNVHVEIEQRWHQVETTPLREEKQVPIAPLHLSSEDSSDRLPTQELTSLLEKELEQSQKEASDLLEQNRLLQDQLKVALGREQSAREGYVLQTEVATSPSGAWQRLHKVNQDLQSELETQCQRQELINHQIQSLKRSYGEAKDIIRHHEAEIQRLQARLSNAAAELAIKEQALAKLKSDLKMEKEKVTEQLEEWQQSESTLSFQLRVSEQQLRSAEALLLEKTQELRDLEMQQALHRDHQKEVQRLQDRIADLSQQLGAREQAQALMEEKLQKNYELLLESCEKEKQALLQNLKEVEDKACEYEDQLQDHEQQMEILQKEKLSAKFEGSEIVHQLEEQLEVKEASIQTLAEHIRSLQEERDEIKQRFSELMNQVAESDHKVAQLQEKLKSWEVDYQTLERSYQKVLEQFQGMHTVLKEKEDELKHIKEMHEKILERKDQDLHEALVKMAALGGSLEETEMKLFRAKEELLRKAADGSTKDMEEPCARLDVQEDSPADLGPRIQVPGAPLGSYNTPLQNEEAGLKEVCGEPSERGPEDAIAPLKSTEPQDQQGHQKTVTKPDGGAPGAKRQRIRFSSIQCQKYIHPEGSEKNWTSSTSSDTSQDRSLSEESMSSEPIPSCISSGVSDPETYLSIIHSLETKLYITEEKLKDVTMKLESQQGQNQETLIALHHQWAGTESQLHEQLQASLSQVGALVSQLENERQEKLKMVENHVGELGDFQIKNSQALTCLEKCREQLRSLPKAENEKERDLCVTTLASLETTLSNAIQVLHHLPSSSSNGMSQAQPGEGSSLNEGQSTLQMQPQVLELTEQEQLRLLSQRIAFEASLINQIAESLKNASSDISHILQEIYLTAKVAMEPTHVVNTATTLADALSKKLILEGEFWNQVEELSKHLEPHREEEANKPEADHFRFPQDLVTAVADTALIRAELGLTAQSMREAFYQKLESIEDNLNKTRIALRQHKCVLGEILKAYRTPDFDRVMQQISETFGLPGGVTGDLLVAGDWSSAEMLPCPDSGGSQECPSLPGQSSVALNEQIAQQLKDRAQVLEEIASALISLPAAAESTSDCQQLLRASQSLSYFSCLSHLGHYSSLLVQDAIIQAQVCYSVCKMRLEYERELKLYKESWKNSVDASYHEPTQAIVALRMEYEELLHKQKNEYLEVISIIERENEELKAKVAQLDCQQRCLEEVESKHSESIFALQGRYEEEIRSVVEQLNSTKTTLQAERTRVLSQLDASVKDKQDMERFHVEQMQTLEDKFQLKIKELQLIHEEELRTLQEHYTQNLQCLQETLNHYQRQNPEVPPSTEPRSIHHIWPTDQLDGAMLVTEGEPDSMTGLRERIQELEAKMNVMREELEHKDLEGNASTLREKYQKDFENLKATCERGFAAMEETHQKKIEDLQRQHQRELEKLREEKDRLLAEETAATISAIEAMKNAHREEMERELEKTHRSQISSVNSDIEALRRQYLEELQSVQRELEVLSEQYSQKCLENAHLAQALEAERQALRQCQRENQELNAHNQELNNRLAAEITRLRTLLTGEGGGEAAGSPLTQGKDAYELEVLLRVKESEIQYLKQEISSLKDELQTALRDKKYASDKYKDIYTELSIVKAKADCDISRLKEQLKAATEALGEKSPENTTVSGYDIMKSKSNPDFLKKDRSSVSRQLRNIRSKSVIEQVSWDN
ncbi:myosin phosphatase Rho-interacting protein isoform X4 [Dromiciops gliroides]|uniref:myosin phosphatase Rho-interacting protein isoform X4 n=1 Tax=Dromiciops gliroides TaxID=33562 RepID=UPI001CC5E07F|nr:myosin phosphatase Rho-interacting protein isoform X4 [Dromiciops gliroides]XP_043829216.1 myosin phosphatase Rho-interacting protein isoform X4 [Dromiciops gliroides]